MLCIPALDAHAAPITTRGISSCGAWINDNNGNAESTLSGLWLVGFLSGMAIASNTDVLTNTDYPSAILWMNNFCRLNPLANTGSGGLVLFNELKKRAGK